VVTATRTPVWDKVDALERYDYERYLRQVAALTQADLEEIFADWRLYRRTALWIVEKTESGEARQVRFHPRKWQEDYEESRTNFDIGLKSRKIGFTTDVLLEVYAKSAIKMHQKSLYMTYEEKVAQETANILQIAHDLNPFKPELAKNNSEAMVFKQTKSRILIATAGAKVLARGSDFTMIHMTEVAHYYKADIDVDNFIAGVLDALARGGRAVYESTPNGEDPIFWATWQNALNGELWRPLFLSVFMDETTDWGIENPNTLQSTRSDNFELSDYETALIRSGQSGLGHIRFLRYEKQKLNAKSPSQLTATAVIGDERMLLQEYPTDDETCFLSSTDTVFEAEAVKLHRLRRVAPMWYEQNGALRIWERPIVGRPYCMFVDTSEGLPQSNWQAVVVLDVERLKYVATLRVKTTLTDLGKRTYDIGMAYNTALLMVERNNHGHTVLHILNEQMAYPNMYYHDESEFSATHALGWPTTAKTKPTMVSDFKELFEAGALEIHDDDALREIGSYRFIAQAGRGQDKYQAPKGGTDDLVIAHMGAIQGRHLAYVTHQSTPVHYGGLG
jgi:hypothetical protein